MSQVVGLSHLRDKWPVQREPGVSRVTRKKLYADRRAPIARRISELLTLVNAVWLALPRLARHQDIDLPAAAVRRWCCDSLHREQVPQCCATRIETT
jgi:hypothetical protein